MKPRSFLDDPKLIRKHRKRLAQIEKERKQFVKELEDAQRLGPADFAIRFNCRDTLLCALLAALLSACAADKPEPIATRPAPSGEQRGYQEYLAPAERQTLYDGPRVIHPQIP